MRYTLLLLYNAIYLICKYEQSNNNNNNLYRMYRKIDRRRYRIFAAQSARKLIGYRIAIRHVVDGGSCWKLGVGFVREAFDKIIMTKRFDTNEYISFADEATMAQRLTYV